MVKWGGGGRTVKLGMGEWSIYVCENTLAPGGCLPMSQREDHVYGLKLPNVAFLQMDNEVYVKNPGHMIKMAARAINSKRF